jgi:hypothetical protein
MVNNQNSNFYSININSPQITNSPQFNLSDQHVALSTHEENTVSITSSNSDFLIQMNLK